MFTQCINPFEAPLGLTLQWTLKLAVQDWAKSTSTLKRHYQGEREGTALGLLKEGPSQKRFLSSSILTGIIQHSL